MDPDKPYILRFQFSHVGLARPGAGVFLFFFFPCRVSMMMITASGPTDRKRNRTERGNVRFDSFVPLVIITRTGRKSPEDSFRTPSFVVLCLSYPTFLGLLFL